MENVGIRSYGQAEQRRRELVLKTYEYEMPFNYPNVTVFRRRYEGKEFHGVEMNPMNVVEGMPDEMDKRGLVAADYIEITEDAPIVRVVVIGSACTPPGYVQVEGEPMDGWRRADEIPATMPVRFRINGLWGMHLRYDQWLDPDQAGNRSVVTGQPYSDLPQEFLDRHPGLTGAMKTEYRETPLTGMSCAIFEIPPCRKVSILGGSETPGWKSDNFPNDAHYSFRIIRTTLAAG